MALASGRRGGKRGIDLNITNGNSSVVVRPLYPRLLAKSDFVHDYPEDLYWEEVEAPNGGFKRNRNVLFISFTGKSG